jgi:hypothetical protein
MSPRQSSTQGSEASVSNQPGSSNGKTPPRATVMQTVRGAGPVTRASAWAVDVAIPRLTRDRTAAHLRQRLRNADDALERTARRLARHKSDRVPIDRDRDTQ